MLGPFNILHAFADVLVVDDLGGVKVDEAVDFSRALDGLGHVEGRVASGVERKGGKGRGRSTKRKGSDGLHNESAW